MSSGLSTYAGTTVTLVLQLGTQVYLLVPQGACHQRVETGSARYVAFEAYGVRRTAE